MNSQQINVFLFSLAFSLSTWGELKPYGTYGLCPQGSARAMGMGGAHVSLAEDAAGMLYNPAAAAIADWRTNAGGTKNLLNNNELDIAGDGTGFGLPQTFTYYSLAYHPSEWAFGIAYGNPFSMELNTFTQNQSLIITNSDLIIARNFSRVFSLGVALHNSIYQQKFQTPESVLLEQRKQTNFISIGMTLRMSDGWGFGLAHSPPISYNMDETLNTQAGQKWFRSGYIPEKTTVGFHLPLKSQITLVVDGDLIGKPHQSIAVGSGGAADSSGIPLKEESNWIFHGGFEWELVRNQSDEVIWRMGTYREPSRFSRTLNRTHWTLGLEVRFGPAILNVAFDQSTNFNNTAQGFNLSLSAL